MIGWAFSLGMLLAGLVHNNMVYVITAGLFAIAGSIGHGFSMLGMNLKNTKQKEGE